MRTLSRLTGGIAAIALVATAAAPASARGWDSYYRHDRGPSAGAIIGALVGVGIIAAIASAASSSKDKPADDRRYDAPPPPADPRDQRGYDDGAGYDSRNNAPRYDNARGVASSEDAAVNACVAAARDQAGRNGDYAEIRGVDRAAPHGSGYDVTGQLEQRSSYRSNDGWSRSFRCSWQDGQVNGLSIN